MINKIDKMIHGYIYAEVNTQYLTKDLIPFVKLDQNIKDAYLKGYEDENEFKEIMSSLGYDIGRLYYVEKKFFSSFYYLADYVACEIHDLSKDNINSSFGLSVIDAKSKLFKEMFFDKDKISLVFFNETNPMALYYFLNLYKEIPTDIVYEQFKSMYQAISFGFADIPKEVIEYVFKYKTSKGNILEEITAELKELEENEENIEDISVSDVLTIYRGEGILSNDYKNLPFSSWSLSKSLASRFAYNDGKLYTATINVKDVIDFVDAELEIWCKEEDLKIISEETIYNL